LVRDKSAHRCKYHFSRSRWLSHNFCDSAAVQNFTPFTTLFCTALHRSDALHAIKAGPAARKLLRDATQTRALCVASNSAPAGLRRKLAQISKSGCFRDPGGKAKVRLSVSRNSKGDLNGISNEASFAFPLPRIAGISNTYKPLLSRVESYPDTRLDFRTIYVVQEGGSCGLRAQVLQRAPLETQSRVACVNSIAGCRETISVMFHRRRAAL
jgi:hypothetical protein